MGLNDITEAIDFIDETVNPGVKRYVANDTIQICDGTACVNLVYSPAGKWIPVGPNIRDTGKGYKNGQITKKVGANIDTGIPIGAFYQYTTVYYYDNSAHLVTGTVIIHQEDAAVSGYAAGFDWGASTSSYDFGADMLAGGGDMYASTSSGGCRPGYCNVPVMAD